MKLEMRRLRARGEKSSNTNDLIFLLFVLYNIKHQRNRLQEKQIETPALPIPLKTTPSSTSTKRAMSNNTWKEQQENLLLKSLKHQNTLLTIL
jgi:hypothetical protein